PLFRPASELLGIQCCAYSQAHHCGHFLTIVRIGHSQYRHLGDIRVLVQDFLDLTGVHIVSTTDDHIFTSIHNVYEAVLVEPAEIPGPEPTVEQCLRGLLGPVPVALHDHRTTDPELTDLLWRKHRACVVAHLDRRARQRQTDRTHPGSFVGRIVGSRT